MNDNLFDIRYVIETVWGVLRRRWWLLLAPALLGAMFSAMIAFLIPPVFQSSALIAVESQQIPSDLARSTVASDASERVRLIQQRLETRQNLLGLAAQFDVFANSEAMSATETVNRMRAALSIQSDGGGRRRRGASVSAIEIAFRANSANAAAQVANALLTQLLEQNIEQRSARASETLDFFTAETTRLAASLEALEAQISNFKNANQDALPESLVFRRNEIITLQREIFERESRLVQLSDRRRILEDTIELGRSVVGDGSGLSQQDRDLAGLRAQLTQLRALYAETHPSVRALVARISAVEDSLAAPAGEGEGDVGAARTLAATAAVAELERIEAEIDRLRNQTEIDAARLGALQDSIGRTPRVEIELGALEREYGAIQAQYRSALAKQAEAETGERLEANQQAERFEVIEQPQVPDQPIAPNRVLIAGLGTAASIGVGLALVVLAELLNPALRTPRDFERKLRLRPIATIPYIRTQGEALRRRWLLRFAVLALVVSPVVGVLLVDWFVLPAQVMAERVMDRTGLSQLADLLSNRLGE